MGMAKRCGEIKWRLLVHSATQSNTFSADCHAIVGCLLRLLGLSCPSGVVMLMAGVAQVTVVGTLDRLNVSCSEQRRRTFDPEETLRHFDAGSAMQRELPFGFHDARIVFRQCHHRPKPFLMAGPVRIAAARPAPLVDSSSFSRSGCLSKMPTHVDPLWTLAAAEAK